MPELFVHFVCVWFQYFRVSACLPQSVVPGVPIETGTHMLVRRSSEMVGSVLYA